jgi:hypothetical protein
VRMGDGRGERWIWQSNGRRGGAVLPLRRGMGVSVSAGMRARRGEVVALGGWQS